MKKLPTVPLLTRLRMWTQTPGNLERFFDDLNFYLLIALGIVTASGLHFGWFNHG